VVKVCLVNFSKDVFHFLNVKISCQILVNLVDFHMWLPLTNNTFFKINYKTLLKTQNTSKNIFFLYLVVLWAPATLFGCHMQWLPNHRQDGGTTTIVIELVFLFLFYKNIYQF
jgi:hypothetical protein